MNPVGVLQVVVAISYKGGAQSMFIQHLLRKSPRHLGPITAGEKAKTCYMFLELRPLLISEDE
ncbi:TPA: hypothetical protein DDW35_04570 [Candidatus Sumerlaeota bacterium]|nr:hypothetical protein [Candidatus Sumerlaeota bacterium]